MNVLGKRQNDFDCCADAVDNMSLYNNNNNSSLSLCLSIYTRCSNCKIFSNDVSSTIHRADKQGWALSTQENSKIIFFSICYCLGRCECWRLWLCACVCVSSHQMRACPAQAPNSTFIYLFLPMWFVYLFQSYSRASVYSNEPCAPIGCHRGRLGQGILTTATTSRPIYGLLRI